MEEDRFDNEDRMELVAKFETMLSNEETFFFDVSEVESIAGYYFEVEEPRKALSIIEIGEQQHPVSENIILFKGEALIQLGREKEAIEVLEYALDLNPLNGNAIRILGTIYAGLLEHEKAQREREFDEKREANEAKDQLYSNPNEYFEYKEEKEKEIELLKTIPPSLKLYYKNKVNEYFNQIDE